MRDTTIRLSFNTLERSVQTTVEIDERTIAVVSMEGAVEVTIDEPQRSVAAAFSIEGADVRMRIETRPNLSVTWSGLDQDT